MSHWLEEAERHQRYKEKASRRSSSKILEHKERIKNNFEKNRNLYENFIYNLNDLSDRINNLPTKYRNEFGKIKFKSKESKLNTHLNFYTTSRRLKKRRFKNLRSLFKFSHQKNVRIVYFSVSKHIDMIEVELKEISMFRERLDKKKLEVGEKKELKTKSEKVGSGDSKDSNYKIKFYFQYKMEQLNKDLANEFIDWLAFKKGTEQLPIPPEQIKHH
ncbi:MAG: hypothetical protein JEY97_15335 [Bacteroidales bacterium]|nr:hypothetical protein [Bacteroidales bacterium]